MTNNGVFDRAMVSKDTGGVIASKITKHMRPDVPTSQYYTYYIMVSLIITFILIDGLLFRIFLWILFLFKL